MSYPFCRYQGPLLEVLGKPLFRMPKGCCISISLHSPLLGPWEATVIFSHYLVGLEAYSSIFAKEYFEPMFSPGKHVDSPWWNEHSRVQGRNEHSALWLPPASPSLSQILPKTLITSLFLTKDSLTANKIEYEIFSLAAKAFYHLVATCFPRPAFSYWWMW